MYASIPHAVETLAKDLWHTPHEMQPDEQHLMTTKELDTPVNNFFLLSDKTVTSAYMLKGLPLEILGEANMKPHKLDLQVGK